MQLSFNTINFQSRISLNQTKSITNAVSKQNVSGISFLGNSTHYYTPRRSAETLQRDLETLKFVLFMAANNKETLSRKEVAHRAGITPHQLNNMINKGIIDSETMALYEKIKIRTPDKFKALPEEVTGSRINAVRKGIEALAAKGEQITGEKIAEITGISVHKVRRMLVNNTAGLNTLKKSIK